MYLKKPDIVSTLEKEGLEFRQRGKTNWTLCPFHKENRPSFQVDPSKQQYRCFGCQSRGDVITFIQKYRKLNFKEALAYLGIDKGRQYKPDPRENKKRTLVKEFKAQCAAYSGRLAWELRGLQRLVHDIRTEKDLELRAWAYHEIPILEYKLDVFYYGSDEEKYLLYKEAIANESTI